MTKKGNTQRILVILGAYPDVGKGILTAACGYLLQQQGLRVLPLKFDGYLNYSSGSMNPYHRSMDVLYDEEEVFVLKDGFETDADSGYYERFLGLELSADHNVTNGQLFTKLLSDELSGRFPPGEILKFAHIRNQQMEWLTDQASRADSIILEVGGTIGDPESAILYNALRSIKNRINARMGVILLAPYFEPTHDKGLAKSNRTKLARQAFERADESGLRPDLVALRCSDVSVVSLDDKEYVASDCGIQMDDIFFVADCSPVYRLPIRLAEQRLHHRFNALMGLGFIAPDIRFEGRLENYCTLRDAIKGGISVQIGIFGKTVSHDSFVSLREAVEHATVSENCRAEIVWIDDLVGNHLEISNMMQRFDGVIMTEGLTHWEEKTAALSFTRINSLPTLCISFGFDLAAVEIARNVCGCADAFLEELETGESPVKVSTSQFVSGNRGTNLRKDSLLSRLYGSIHVAERHRHQSWLSQELVDLLTATGVLASGCGEDGNLDAFELPAHPFFVAMKAHPEFKSWPGRPSPPFVGLVRAAMQRSRSRT